MDLFLTFFGGKPVPPQVDKFTCFFPSPFIQRPLVCRRRCAALVPGPSASALACRRRRRAALVPGPSASALACRRRRRAALVPGPSASALACCRRRRAGSRPLPVSVRPRLPSSSSSRMRPTDHRSPAAARAFAVLSALSALVDCCDSHYLFSMLCDGQHRWERVVRWDPVSKATATPSVAR